MKPGCRVSLVTLPPNLSRPAVARDHGKTSDQSRMNAETLETIKCVHDGGKGDNECARSGINCGGKKEGPSAAPLNDSRASKD